MKETRSLYSKKHNRPNGIELTSQIIKNKTSQFADFTNNISTLIKNYMKKDNVLHKIQLELKKYNDAQLKMEGSESRLNKYLKSKIINDCGDYNLNDSSKNTLFNGSFDNEDIYLSNLAGDGLCLMFGVYGMHINTAIQKIQEDGYIYTSKITNVDLSY